jgi:hypothetical protein
MRTIKFITYLFYKYYSTGSTKRIPYLSSIPAVRIVQYGILNRDFPCLLIRQMFTSLPGTMPPDIPKSTRKKILYLYSRVKEKMLREG